MTGLESKVRGWFEWITSLNPPSWAVGILIAVLGWQVGFGHPTSGLDASWVVGLYMAAHDHMEFGTEIVFTYGPLGFLRYPWLVYAGEPSLVSFLYSSALFVAFCTVLVAVLRRRVTILPASFIALVVVVQLGWIEFAVAVSVMTAMLIIERRPSERGMLAIAVAGGCLAGAEMLVKLSGGPVIGLVLLIGLVGVRAKIRIVAVYLAVMAFSLLGLWFLTGQALGNLDDFALNSVSIVAGYQEAMSIHGQSFWYAIAILLAALACVAWALFGCYPDRRVRWAAGLIALVVVFSYYKQAMVRMDRMHIATFFTIASLLFLAVPPRRGLVAGSLGGLACLAVVSMYASGSTPSPGLNVIGNVNGLFREARMAFSPARQEAQIAQTRAILQYGYGLPPGLIHKLQNRTVSVEPWETTAAWAYELDWSPVPVFQNYSSYTSRLDRLNADAVASADGPERILRHIGENPASPTTGLDGRFLAWDPPRQSLATLCNFRPVAQSDRWQVLARTADRCGPLVLAETVEASPGEPVAVPRPGPSQVVLVKIAGADGAFLDRLKSLFYRTGEQRVVTSSGSYRLVAATAKDGLLLRIGRNLSEGRGRFALAPQSATVMLTGSPGELSFEFFRMDVGRNSRPGTNPNNP